MGTVHQREMQVRLADSALVPVLRLVLFDASPDDPSYQRDRQRMANRESLWRCRHVGVDSSLSGCGHGACEVNCNVSELPRVPVGGSLGRLAVGAQGVGDLLSCVGILIFENRSQPVSECKAHPQELTLAPPSRKNLPSAGRRHPVRTRHSIPGHLSRSARG